MPQCPEFTTTPTRRIHCVLEAGHELIPSYLHNFGGLGPYSPRIRQTWDETWLALAHGIAQRSLCSRDQVGAVIVSQDNTPLMASYNGPPAGFEHRGLPCTEWCPRARGDDFTWEWPVTHPVGAPEIEMSSDGVFALVAGQRILIDKDEQYERLGFQKKVVLSPNYEDCPALHAEANGLSKSNHMHRKGGTIYVTSDVCFPCAKLIANSGIGRVVVDQTKPRDYRNANKSYEFLESCGLLVALTIQEEITP